MQESDSTIRPRIKNITSHDGYEIVYREYGSQNDQPLLLIHGLGSDYSMWSPQIERYSDMGCRVIVPDIRGHGDSEHVPHFEIGDCASDLVQILDDLGIDTVSVIGVSMGSLVGQEMTVRHPDRVGKLVLADTFSRIYGLRARFYSKLQTIFLAKLPVNIQLHLLKSGLDDDDGRLLQYYQSQLREMDRDQLVQARRAVNRFDRYRDLRNIEAPTLVIVGGDNPEWFIALSRETAEEIPSGNFVQLSKGTDPSNLTATAEFDSTVSEYLSS